MGYVCNRCLETKNNGKLFEDGKFICSDCIKLSKGIVGGKWV